MPKGSADRVMRHAGMATDGYASLIDISRKARGNDTGHGLIDHLTTRTNDADTDSGSVQFYRAESGRGPPAGSGSTTSALHETLASSIGSRLPADTSSRMSEVFGYNFEHVRVHIDAPAVTTAETVNARAFTIGDDIYFDRGQFHPGTDNGDALLAHELAHVVQFDQGRVAPARSMRSSANGDLALSQPGDPLEQEAEAVAKAVGAGSPATPPVSDARPARGAVGTGDSVIMASFWDTVADTTSAAWGGITDTAEAGWDAAAEFGEDVLFDLIAAVSPGLATLISEGPAEMLREALTSAVDGWLGGMLSALTGGDFVGDLVGALGKAMEVLQGVMNGDPTCCATFSRWMKGLSNLITGFIKHPAIGAMKSAFEAIDAVVVKIWTLVVAPVFDSLAAILGGAWSAITSVVDTIRGWISAASDAVAGAWDFIKDTLGISDNSEGGIWSMIKDAATSIWDSIRSTLEPIMGPLKTVATVLAMLTPFGPVYLLIEVVPEVISAVSWLVEHWGQPDLVEQADAAGGRFLPDLARAVTGLGGALTGAASWLVETLGQVGAAVTELATAVTGVPLVGIAAGFLRGVADTVNSLLTWAGDALTSAAKWVTKTADAIWSYIKPICEVLLSLAICAVNPAMIPVVLGSWAWMLIPDCYKGPIIDFIFDVVISLLRAAPDLVMFGPLWLAFKPGVIGFLENFRGQTTDVKVAVSNKFARILSGSSLAFIGGFVAGFLTGVWEGLTDPFVMAYQLVTGLIALGRWLGNLSVAPRAPEGTIAEAKTTDTPAAPGDAPAPSAVTDDLATRADQMWKELGPEVDVVAAQFWPAVQEFFRGDGLGFEGLVSKFQELWPLIQTKIHDAGAALSQQMCAWFMSGDSEYNIGHGIGWLVGTIAFELVLAYFTAGAGAALIEGSRALKYFLRALDWTGEALGAAFKLIGKVGGWLMDLVRALGRTIGTAGAGAIRTLMEAIDGIASKLTRWSSELDSHLPGGAHGISSSLPGNPGAGVVAATDRPAGGLMTPTSGSAPTGVATNDALDPPSSSPRPTGSTIESKDPRSADSNQGIELASGKDGEPPGRQTADAEAEVKPTAGSDAKTSKSKDKVDLDKKFPDKRGDDAYSRTGPGTVSNPVEYDEIMKDLKKQGVTVVESPGKLAYQPSWTPGMPGEIYLDPEASFSALVHEYQHFLDDAALGFPGQSVLYQPNRRWAMEHAAYAKEIQLARRRGDLALVKDLEKARLIEWQRIFKPELFEPKVVLP